MRRYRHNANSVRIASSLRSDMIFRRDRTSRRSFGYLRVECLGRDGMTVRLLVKGNMAHLSLSDCVGNHICDECGAQSRQDRISTVANKKSDTRSNVSNVRFGGQKQTCACTRPCPLRAIADICDLLKQKDRLAAVSPKIHSSSLRSLRCLHCNCRGPRHQRCKYNRNENERWYISP